MGNGVSAPPGGAGLDGPASALQGSPFVSSAVLSSASRRRSSRLRAACEAKAAGSSVDQTFCSAVDPPKVPSASSCALKSLPLPLPLLPALSDSALPPPPSSTRSEPPYLSPWLSSSPDSLSPCSSCPAHPPSRRSSRPSSAFGRGSPECSHSGTTLIPEAALHALREKNLDAISGLPPASDMAYGVLCPGAVSCAEDNGSGAFLLSSAALPKGREDAHLAAGDSSLPMGERATGGADCLVSCFPPAFSREAISAYVSRSSRAYLLEAVRQEADHRSLSDDEMGPLPSGGGGGSGSSLVADSPAISATEGTTNSGVRLSDHFFLLPAASGGAPAVNPPSTPSQNVVSLSPACLSCPSAHPTSRGATGTGEAGQIVSRLADCVEDSLLSEALKGTLQAGETVRWGVAGGKVEELEYQLPCAEAGARSLKARNFFELAQNGAQSRGRDPGTIVPPRPDPFAWPAGGTGSLRGGRGLSTRSSRGRGRSATSATSSASKKSLGKSGVLENSLSFGVPPPSQKTRGFLLSSLPSTGLASPIPQGSSDPAVNARCIHRACEANDVEASPDGNSLGPADTWGGSRAPLVQGSCGERNSASSTASGGAGDGGPGLRRGRSCLEEMPSTGGGRPAPALFASSPAPGDVRVVQAANETADGQGGTHVITHGSTGLAHVSGTSAPAKNGEGGDRPEACYQCCNREHMAPLSAPAGRSRPPPTCGGRAEDDPDVLVAAGQAGALNSYACCSETATNLYSRRSAALAASPGPAGCTCSLVRSGNSCGGTMSLANSAPLADGAAAVDVTRCFLHSRARDSAARDIAGSCENADGVLFKVRGGGAPRERGEKDDACLGGKRGKHRSSFSPGQEGRSLFAERPTESDGDIRVTERRRHSAESFTHLPLPASPHLVLAGRNKAGGLWNADAGIEASERGRPQRECCGGRTGTLEASAAASLSALRAKTGRETHTGIAEEQASIPGAPLSQVISGGGGGRSASGTGKVTGVPLLFPKREEKGGCSQGHGVGGTVNSASNSGLAALSGDLTSSHLPSCALAKCAPPGSMVGVAGGAVTPPSAAIAVSSASGFSASASGAPFSSNTSSTGSSGGGSFSHSSSSGGSGGGALGGGAGPGKGGNGGPGGPGGGGKKGGGPGGGGGGSHPSSARDRGAGKECQSVDFYVRSFWKVAKTQNDLESPTQGYCRGFVYRLLLHPRGTTGTDSEASHLSVFLEAIRQDWYPDDWIFPNVRFELTVVNFKDPKQSVTSWAHWSFSNEATSRGWQKMISHARLNKQSGFMDEDGTVLVRGKAEPPFASLWSRGPVYRPHRIWEYIPERAAKALEEVSSSCSAAAAALTGANTSMQTTGQSGNNAASGANANNLLVAGPHSAAPGGGLPRLKTPTASLLSYVDPIVPTLDSSLGADYVALFVHCLFHLCEFRKHVYMWKSDFIKAPTVEQLAQDPSLAAQIPPFADGSLIGALQQTFAYMQLWPVTVACRRLQQLAASSSSSRKEICASEIWKWYGAELFPKNSPSRRPAPPPLSASASRLAFCTLCKRCTCCCRCKTTAYHAAAWSAPFVQGGSGPPSEGPGRKSDDEGRSSGGTNGAEDPEMFLKQMKLDRDTCLCCDLMDRYPEAMIDMPPQPNIKAVLKALHMHDVQKMDVPDPLVKVHTELFSLLMRELAKAKLETHQVHEYQARAVAAAAAAAAAAGSAFPSFSSFGGRDAEAGEEGGLPSPGGVPGGPAPAGVWTDVDGVAFTSCDHLEATCHELFSSSDRSTGLLNADGVPDISAGFTRCKHVHSLQKALESCGKVLQHFPEVLFVYLQSVKQCKKGELFDAPLRLDAHKLLQLRQQQNANEAGNADGHSKGNGGEKGAGTTTGVVDREKQRRRLRKKLQQSRKGNKVSRDAQEEESDITEDEELAISDEDDLASTQGDGKGAGKGDGKGGQGAQGSGQTSAQGGAGAGPGGPGSTANHGAASAGNVGNQEKWFSLFALFIREGDSRGDGCGAHTSHYLLLRPEEDGPWFRIGDGRVERLSSKVDFTEWKCHRDFFCAGAVYVAEDYIDAVQAGDVDLSGDLLELNPWLYYRTLYDLGITEAEIKRPWINLANKPSGATAVSGSACSSPVGGSGARASGEASASLEGDGHAEVAPEQRDDSNSERQLGLAAADAGKTGADSGGLVSGTASPFSCPSAGSGVPAVSSNASVVPGVRPFFEGDGNAFHETFESAWRPRTLAEERRYTVLAPVIKWIFEVAVEKAVVFAANSPELVENHYWFVLRMQYLEKILLLELRHAICEVLYDEWLTNYVTPFVARSYKSALTPPKVHALETVAKNADASARDGTDEEGLRVRKLLAAISFFFRDDEEGGAAAATAVMSASRSEPSAVEPAASGVSSASGEKGEATAGEKTQNGNPTASAEENQASPTKEKERRERTESLASSPTHVGPRETAEVIAHWARTHLSDNGRLLVDELGTLLKDPLHRLVDRISTLRHEVEILCREGRSRSLLYRVGAGASADACAAGGVQPTPSEKQTPHDSALQKEDEKGEKNEKGEKSEGDEKGEVAGEDVPEPEALAELRQAVTERLTDLWRCCRECVKESEGILSKFTVERLRTSSFAEPEAEEERRTSERKSEETSAVAGSEGDKHRRDATKSGGGAGEEKETRSGADTVSPAPNEPSFSPLPPSLPPSAADPSRCVDRSAALSAGRATGGALDHLGHEYDLSTRETVELVAFLSEAFFLPDFRTMRRFLRDRRHLVFERIRPHELIRAYLSLARPEVHLPSFLHEHGYNVTWCEAAFQPEDVSAIWGDASVPDVVAVQSVSRGFQLRRAVSSVLLHLLVTALECGPSESGLKPGSQSLEGELGDKALARATDKAEKDGTTQAKGSAAGTVDGSSGAASSKKKGKKKKGAKEEVEKKAKADEPGEGTATSPKTGDVRPSEEPDPLRGEDIRTSLAADVSAILRAMEHDCPDLASPTSFGMPAAAPSQVGSASGTAASTGNAPEASTPGLLRDIPSPPPEASSASGGQQAVLGGETADYQSQLATIRKIPLTLPLPGSGEKSSSSQASGTGGKCGKKKGRVCGLGGGSSSGSGDPTHVVPVLDRVLPRLNFEQRIAAAADPGVFLLCPAALSSSLSSFAPSPRASCSLTSPAGGAGTPAFNDVPPDVSFTAKPGSANAGGFGSAFASGSCASGAAHASALERELLGLGDSGVVPFPTCGTLASRGLNGGAGSAFLTGSSVCRRIRYHGLELGLLLAEDLKGLEGFSIEDSLPIRARLLVRKSVLTPTGGSLLAGAPAPNPLTPPVSSPSSASPSPSAGASALHATTQPPPAVSEPLTVQRLYWAFRRLLHAQIEECDVGADDATAGTSSGGAGKGKNPSTAKACEQQLALLNQQSERELWWLPTPRDAFLLYALRPDPDPTRKGRRRFVYMDPLDDLEIYADPKRQLADSSAPDITILLVAAPQRCCSEASAWLKGSTFSSAAITAAASAVPGVVLPPPALTFPLEDADEFPLLVFKWFSADSVDLFCVGALVCDAKQQLQTYILDWLVPHVRARGYLSPLPSSTMKDDAENFLVLEECHLRTVQNIRRWSCAIRKINKRGGDVIIVQKKGLIESPASIRYRESSALLEKVRLYEVAHHHCGDGVGGEFDLGEGVASASLPPLASTVSGAAGSGDFLLEGNDLLSIPPDGAGGAGDRVLCAAHLHNLDEGEGDDGAGGGGKKKKKKQKKVLPRAAIPSNRKSVIARLAEDQRREETTLLKAAAKGQEKDDFPLEDTAVQAAAPPSAGASPSASSADKKSAAAGSAVSEDEDDVRVTGSTTAAKTTKGGKKVTPDDSKGDRTKSAQASVSPDKEGTASGKKAVSVANIVPGKSSSTSPAAAKTSGGGVVEAADGKHKGTTGGASSSGKAAPSEKSGETGDKKADGSSQSEGAPSSGTKVSSVEASAVGSKKGKKEAAESAMQAAVEQSSAAGPGEDKREDASGENTLGTGVAWPASAHLGSVSASSPPLSPASSTISRGSSFSIVALPGAIQMRLSPAAQQLLQRVSDKQHMASPALLREAAAILVDEFLSRVSQIYRNAAVSAIGGDSGVEKKGGVEARTSGETLGSSESAGGSGAACGAGAPASASWAVLVGAGIGSVAVDEISECAESLEAICSTCFSTQQRPIFIKEIQVLLDREIHGQGAAEPEAGEKRAAGARKGDSGEKGAKASGASAAAMARPKKEGFYSGVAAGKASSAAQEASVSDARLEAFYRLFSCRRRAASELFALLSVTRGGQLVTRKLVAQYCLAALDKEPAGGSAASSPLLGVASVILMWLFLGPRLICKLGDSQQGRRFIDGGLRKIFDFFQQRTALSLQLQQTAPASLLSSPTAVGSTPGAGGRAAPQQTDPVALVAWAAGVLLKVFHLSRASQLVLPRQTDVLSALQQIQLPSAFLSKALATSVASSPSSVWGAGGAGLLAAAGGAGTGTAVEAQCAGVSGDTLGSDSTSSARDGKPQASAGRGGLLLPPLSASVSAGGSVVSGPSSWGSSSTPAESSASAHGLLEEAGGKKTSSQRASQPPVKSPETGGSSPVAAARAAGGEAAGGEGAQGAARGLAKGSSSRGPLLSGVQHAKGAGVIGASPSSPAASGAPGKLVAAVDEREDSDDEENEGAYREEGEEESADLQATQEEELVVGEQSLYGSGKALSRRVFKKAAPYVVEEGSTWMVLYKPAFWHCSGFGRDRPVFVPRVATPQELEEALAHISLEDMISSGKIESFHLYMMKKYPRLETVRRWEEMECGLCHRTDLETSGSLLIAKTRRARESIFEQFRKRLVHKEYLLLCHGRLDKLHARIDHPIATRDFDSSRSKSHFSEVVGPDEGGDEALTEYQVVRVFGVRQPVHRKIQAAMSVAARIASSPSSSSSSSSAPSDRARGSGAAAAGAKAAGSGKGSPVSGTAAKKDFSYSQEFSFCRVRIHTGRTHQIRVHFRHIGHPLVGDTKYCDLYKCTVDRSWCARMFLHSAVLEFDNPDKTETQHVRVVCPLATELLAALENELVCLEDYSQITADMLDRTGQVKKEYRHLVVSNPTGPPDGSVPGYSALPAAASSPSSSRSGPLLQGVVGSSPPLLPLAPAALAAEGRLTPSSPLSLPPERLRDTRAPTVASAAATASSPPKAPASPPVSKSSPVILSSEKSQKVEEPAPVTLPGRALDAREAERKAEQDEARTRDAVKQTPADEKPATCPSSENQPPLLPVELPSRQKDTPLSPSSGEGGVRQPPMPPVLAPAPASNFSGIFDSLLDALRQSGEVQGSGSYAGETRRSEAGEGSQASAFPGEASDAGRLGLAGEWRRRRYLEEADWSVADICQEKQRETRPGADLSDAEAMSRARAARQWSYREFATDLADLMRLPAKEEDASGLRRLTEAVATAVPLPTVREEEQVRQYWGSVHAAQRVATARSRERMLENALQALVRLLHLSELQREVFLPASLNPQENADAQARGASASASAEVRQRCRYIAFDSRSGKMVAREDGHLLIPSFADAASGALGGVQNPQAAGIASLNSVAFWKVLLESLGAHYPADICVRWDANKRAILVLLLLENTAEMKKISQAAASQGPQQHAAAQARAFLDFHRALRDLSKFEIATPALARAVGNVPLPRESWAQGHAEKVADGRIGGSESKEAAVVVGPLQDRRRRSQGAAEGSSASLWRMQAWRKYTPGGDVSRALGECEFDVKQGFRSRFPLGDLPPFRQQMGPVRAPDLQFNQSPLLPHNIGPAHVPMGGLPSHPHISDFHNSSESRPQHPLLASGLASRLGQGLTPQERQFVLSQQSGGSTSFLLPALPSLSENLSGHDSSGSRFDASQRNLLRLPGAPGSGAALGSGPGAGLVTRPSWAPSVWGSPGAGTASGAAGGAGGDGALARGLGAQGGGDGREDLRRGPAEGSAPMAPFVFLWEAEGEGQADATPPNNAEVQEEEIRDLMDLSFMMGSTPSSGHGQTAGPGSVSPSPETGDRGASGVPGFESLGVDEARGDSAALQKLPVQAPTPGAKEATGVVGEGSRRRNEESRGGVGQTPQQGQDESSVLLRDMGGELREGVRHFSEDQASAAADGSFMSRLQQEAWQGSSGLLSSASKALSNASSPTSSLLSFGQPGALRSSQAGAGPSLFLMMGQHGGAGGERRFGAPGESLASSSASLASGGARTRGQTLSEVEGTLQETSTREGEAQVLGNDKWCVRIDIPHPPSEAPPHPSIMFLHQKVAREMLEGETRGAEGRRGAGDEGDNRGPALAARAAAALLSRQYCNGAAAVENALHDQLAQQRRVGDMWGSSVGSLHAGAAMGVSLGRHGAGEEVSGVDEEFLLGRRNSTGMTRGVGPGAGGPRPSPSPPGNMPVPPAHIHPSLRSHLAAATAPGFPLGDGTAPFGGGRATPGISSDLHASSGGGGLIGRGAALPSPHMNAGGRPMFGTNEFPLRASNHATDSGRGRPFAPSGFCGAAGGSATDLGDGDLRGPLLPQAAQDPRLHALDMRNAQPQSLQAPHRMGDSLLGAGGLPRLPALGQPGGPNAGPSSGNSGREDEKA
ncbi:RNA pseudouridine synthase superfamily protein [Toxoplasma gondii VAND]|uniref:RNA pseudouridine synthase superfamily protein n=1 Tax=Toxoplasma gondii VAND TaxID=933077 RepID=A0A086PR15_TOXGO|nr:RNA pseudouridine synthase superfamily protein [Toxoplasma gondii VAND]